MSDYDVIVFGGGPPSEHCAAVLAARQWRVSLVKPAWSAHGCHGHAAAGRTLNAQTASL